MGWCNETASNAIKSANNTLDKEERIAQYAIVQQEFANDLPSLPLFNRTEVNASNKDVAGFAPHPGQEYVTYNVDQWEIPGKDTIVLGFSEEPASLFILVEDAFVASNAAALVFGRPYTSIDYDYAANLYFKQLPTLENGKATIVTVDVKDGDKIVDANGDLVELAAGMKIKEADGNLVDISDYLLSVSLPRSIEASETTTFGHNFKT